jgi:hypothetical protein
MHTIKLMLINYLPNFYSSKLCIKVICTSYDIPKTETQNQFGGRARGVTGSDRSALPSPTCRKPYIFFSFIIYVYNLSLRKTICTQLVVYRKKLYIQLVVREKYIHISCYANNCAYKLYSSTHHQIYAHKLSDKIL